MVGSRNAWTGSLRSDIRRTSTCSTATKTLTHAGTMLTSLTMPSRIPAAGTNAWTTHGRPEVHWRRGEHQPHRGHRRCFWQCEAGPAKEDGQEVEVVQGFQADVSGF